jgi:hypothetical protein
MELGLKGVTGILTPSKLGGPGAGEPGKRQDDEARGAMPPGFR